LEKSKNDEDSIGNMKTMKPNTRLKKNNLHWWWIWELEIM